MRIEEVDAEFMRWAETDELLRIGIKYLASPIPEVTLWKYLLCRMAERHQGIQKIIKDVADKAKAELCKKSSTR